MFALSFVRTEKDVLDLKSIMKRAGKEVPVIAKIETQEAIDHLDAILEAADGAMVARGDLAIEVPTELVPVYQKRIIEKCNHLGKPAITATQMLESMIVSPVPTRAEVSDIANAIYDGTDAVMLSEESTLGAYPVEAVSVMARVAKANEIPQDYRKYYNSIPDSISRSVYKTARNVKAGLIVALTESGQSARLVERFSPNVPIIALTPNKATVQRLALTSNVYAYQLPGAKSFDHVLEFVPKFLKAEKLAKKGDTIVLTAGVPFGVKGSTNMVVVLTIA
jgi:pyruvate kinase